MSAELPGRSIDSYPYLGVRISKLLQVLAWSSQLEEIKPRLKETLRRQAKEIGHIATEDGLMFIARVTGNSLISSRHHSRRTDEEGSRRRVWEGRQDSRWGNTPPGLAVGKQLELTTIVHPPEDKWNYRTATLRLLMYRPMTTSDFGAADHHLHFRRTEEVRRLHIIPGVLIDSSQLHPICLPNPDRDMNPQTQDETS